MRAWRVDIQRKMLKALALFGAKRERNTLFIALK